MGTLWLKAVEALEAGRAIEENDADGFGDFTRGRAG